MVADFEAVFFFGAFAQLHYLADILVSGDNRGMVVNRLRKISVTVINFGVGGANAAPADFYYYFFFAGFRVRNIFVTEITFAMNDYCFQFFTSLYISFSLYQNWRRLNRNDYIPCRDKISIRPRPDFSFL